MSSQHSRRRRLSLSAIAVSAMVALAPSSAGAEEVHLSTSSAPLRLGIVPQQSATRLAEVWTPFLNAVEDASGLALSFNTAKDIPTFEACLAQGAYDIAYMNPYHYTVFHDIAGYEAFGRQKDKMLRGIIVTRRDAPMSSLDDLEGAVIGFPSPAAFGASVIPRAELAVRRVRFHATYVKSHDSVYRAVSAGLLTAGGGVQRTFNTVPEDLRAQLKIIHQTDAYTPHAFAAHPRVADDVVARLLRAMEGLEHDSPQVLAPLGMAGVERAADADWRDVRALNLHEAHTQIVEYGAAACHSD